MPTEVQCGLRDSRAIRTVEAATVAFHCRKYTLATPNYGYEKRQRELAKKKKKEEKLRARASNTHRGATDDGSEPMPAAPTGQEEQAPNAANP